MMNCAEQTVPHNWYVYSCVQWITAVVCIHSMYFFQSVFLSIEEPADWWEAENCEGWDKMFCNYNLSCNFSLVKKTQRPAD